MTAKNLLLKNSTGAVLIITALLVATFVIISALVIDGISAAATKKQLVVISEQAAIAFMETLAAQTSNINPNNPPSASNYLAILNTAKARAATVAKQNATLGNSDGFPANGQYNSGNDSLGIIQVGRWIPEDDLTNNCDDGGTKPCFNEIDEDDLLDPDVPFRINAVRVTTRSPGPIRYFIANFFNAELLTLSGGATAWVPPTDFMFLVDLSPSIVRDSHLMRNPNHPGICTSMFSDPNQRQLCIDTLCYNPNPDTPLTDDSFCPLRGMQAEYAFSNDRIFANDPSSVMLNDLTNCYAGVTAICVDIPNPIPLLPPIFQCPNPTTMVQSCLDRNEIPPTGANNCLPDNLLPIDSVTAFERSSHILATADPGDLVCTAIRVLGEGAVNSLILSLGGEAPPGGEPVFQIMSWSREICAMAKCDWLGLRLNRALWPTGAFGSAPPRMHFKSDYLNLTVTDPELGTRNFAIDVAAEDDGNLRRAEPLFSILNGINYFAKSLNFRRKGDGIGMIGNWWHPDHAIRGFAISTFRT